MAIDVKFAISFPTGILKLIQFFVSIIVLICLACASWTISGQGFIYFTAVATLMTAMILLILYILNFPQTIGSKLPVPWSMLEFIVVCVWALFYFISFCMACAWSAKYSNIINANFHSVFGATAFFALIVLLALLADAYFLLRRWRFGAPTPGAPPAAATTTTTHTTTTYEHTTTYDPPKY